MIKLFSAAQPTGGLTRPTNSTTGLPDVTADPSALQTGLTIVFAIAGAVALLMIVIAAFNFVTAEGDPEKIARARKSIQHALIGLAIALLAEAIVQTVIGKL